MEHSYPITRDQLRNMSAIINAQHKQEFINKMVDYASMQIIHTATQSKNNCEIICVQLQQVQRTVLRHVHVGGEIYAGVRDGSFEPYINAVVDDLKCRFPDCRITQDPARKYLFVDWS